MDNASFVLIDISACEKTLVAGVFDGNTGPQCSKFLATQVASEIKKNRGEILCYADEIGLSDAAPLTLDRFFIKIICANYTSIDENQDEENVKEYFMKFKNNKLKEYFGKLNIGGLFGLLGFNIPKLQNQENYIELLFNNKKHNNDSEALAIQLLDKLKKDNLISQNKCLIRSRFEKPNQPYYLLELQLSEKETKAILDRMEVNFNEFDRILVQGTKAKEEISHPIVEKVEARKAEEEARKKAEEEAKRLEEARRNYSLIAGLSSAAITYAAINYLAPTVIFSATVCHLPLIGISLNPVVLGASIAVGAVIAASMYYSMEPPTSTPIKGN